MVKVQRQPIVISSSLSMPRFPYLQKRGGGALCVALVCVAHEEIREVRQWREWRRKGQGRILFTSRFLWRKSLMAADATDQAKPRVRVHVMVYVRALLMFMFMFVSEIMFAHRSTRHRQV